MTNINVPEDLADLIDSIIAYKEKLKHEDRYEEKSERLHIYDHIEDYYKEKEESEESWKIEISL